MSIETLLAVLLVVTNVLWAVNTHKLLNKLMSRSFFEYRDATLKEVEKRPIIHKSPPNDFEDFGALNEIMP